MKAPASPRYRKFALSLVLVVTLLVKLRVPVLFYMNNDDNGDDDDDDGDDD